MSSSVQRRFHTGSFGLRVWMTLCSSCFFSAAVLFVGVTDSVVDGGDGFFFTAGFAACAALGVRVFFRAPDPSSASLTDAIAFMTASAFTSMPIFVSILASATYVTRGERSLISTNVGYNARILAALESGR